MTLAARLGNLAPRISSPFIQNVVSGIGIAFSAGVFVSLNLLGAGGGRPESARVIQTANAILSSVWFFSACVGGTYLHLLGPGVTMCCGICTYAIYVGSLWYYEVTGHAAFPLIGGAIVGVGAGAVFVTSGYIQVAYSNDRNKGKFIAIQNTLQAAGSIACSILPVILNRNDSTRSGAPPAVYVTYIVVMLVVALLSLITLRRPAVVMDGASKSGLARDRRGFRDEIKTNMAVLKDWKLLIMLPAFLPAGSFLIYLGSVNVFQNNLRARSLLSFIALVVQIPLGHALHFILDKQNWTRRKRGLTGLAFIAVLLSAAWLWEIVRAKDFDRSHFPENPVDWDESEFGPIMILFVLNWSASILWQYIVPWFIGSLDLPAEAIGHYMGVQRGFLAAGEAICFGADAAGIPYIAFAGAIYAFYALGVVSLAYVGACHITSSPRMAEADETLVDGRLASCLAVNEKGGVLTTVDTTSTRLSSD